jgi:hypothetical protein
MSWLKSFFGPADAPQVVGAESSSAPDVITYLASLASNPREIDAMLDGLRQVTGKSKGGMLSEQDQMVLADVYQKLLHYLVEQEPLRAYTREEIITKVKKQFKPQPNEVAFWRKVGV